MPEKYIKIYQQNTLQLNLQHGLCFYLNLVDQKGYSVSILDCLAENLSIEEAYSRIIDLNPKNNMLCSLWTECKRWHHKYEWRNRVI